MKVTYITYVTGTRQWWRYGAAATGRRKLSWDSYGLGPKTTQTERHDPEAAMPRGHPSQIVVFVVVVVFFSRPKAERAEADEVGHSGRTPRVVLTVTS
jgi:hypothetical protein